MDRDYFKASVHLLLRCLLFSVLFHAQFHICADARKSGGFMKTLLIHFASYFQEEEHLEIF